MSDPLMGDGPLVGGGPLVRGRPPVGARADDLFSSGAVQHGVSASGAAAPTRSPSTSPGPEAASVGVAGDRGGGPACDGSSGAGGGSGTLISTGSASCLPSGDVKTCGFRDPVQKGHRALARGPKALQGTRPLGQASWTDRPRPPSVPARTSPWRACAWRPPSVPVKPAPAKSHSAALEGEVLERLPARCPRAGQSQKQRRTIGQRSPRRSFRTHTLTRMRG